MNVIPVDCDNGALLEAVDSRRLFNYDWALRLTVNAAITEFEDMTDSDNVVDSTHLKG